MSLTAKYPKEVKQILMKYPPEHKRSPVMPLLYLAQRDEGYLTIYQQLAELRVPKDTQQEAVSGGVPSASR